MDNVMVGAATVSSLTAEEKQRLHSFRIECCKFWLENIRIIDDATLKAPYLKALIQELKGGDIMLEDIGTKDGELEKIAQDCGYLLVIIQ
jgi:hypothetical protein